MTGRPQSTEAGLRMSPCGAFGFNTGVNKHELIERSHPKAVTVHGATSVNRRWHPCKAGASALAESRRSSRKPGTTASSQEPSNFRWSETDQNRPFRSGTQHVLFWHNLPKSRVTIRSRGREIWRARARSTALASWQPSGDKQARALPTGSKKRRKPQTSSRRCLHRDGRPYRNIGTHGP